MIKAAGIVLILGACCGYPICKIHQIREEIAVLERLGDTFASLVNEMQHHAPDMQELLSLGARQPGVIGTFFHSMCLSKIREMSFEALWRTALQGADLPRSAKVCLLPLGGILGRYDRQTQCQAMQEAAEKLKHRADALKRTLQTNQRLWYTLSLSSGLVVILLLV